MDETTEKSDYKYIEPEELGRELEKLRKDRKVSERLGELFLLLVDQLAFRPNFINYTNNWKEEMKDNAILHLCKYAHNFNPSYKNANPFAYCTQIAFNAFVQTIKKEKQQESIKRDMYERNRYLIENLNSIREPLGDEDDTDENQTS